MIKKLEKDLSTYSKYFVGLTCKIKTLKNFELDYQK